MYEGICPNCRAIGFVYEPSPDNPDEYIPVDCYPCKGTGMADEREREERIEGTIKALRDSYE